MPQIGIPSDDQGVGTTIQGVPSTQFPGLYLALVPISWVHVLCTQMAALSTGLTLPACSINFVSFLTSLAMLSSPTSLGIGGATHLYLCGISNWSDRIMRALVIWVFQQIHLLIITEADALWIIGDHVMQQAYISFCKKLIAFVGLINLPIYWNQVMPQTALLNRYH